MNKKAIHEWARDNNLTEQEFTGELVRSLVAIAAIKLDDRGNKGNNTISFTTNDSEFKYRLTVSRFNAE